jgi:hypothetical protein
MKRLRIFAHPSYWNKLKPSQSFLKKLSLSLTKQISGLINDQKFKACFTDILELSFYNHGVKYNTSCPMSVFMCLEAKNQPLIVSNFQVDWTPISNNKFIVYPWDDIREIEVEFAINISSDEIKKLNYLLPYLYTPIIYPDESGLTYEYQIKSQSSDGTLVFYPIDEFENEYINELMVKLHDFFQKYNDTNDKKIHDIGDFKKYKNGTIAVNVDFSSCSQDAIISCLYSFKNMHYIKKIVYK